MEAQSRFIGTYGGLATQGKDALLYNQTGCFSSVTQAACRDDNMNVFMEEGANSCSALEQKNPDCLVQNPEDGENMEPDCFSSALCCRDLDFFSFPFCDCHRANLGSH